MGKLWEKDYRLDELVEAFTVGEDYRTDQKLVNADCVSSLAHGDMLRSIGLLTVEEFTSLKKELIHIIKINGEGKFVIQLSDEDCHTAIENHLTSVLGDVGKKIHTGRSRNDQVIAAVRLYAKDFLLAFQDQCLSLAQTIVSFADKHKSVPMPGRTHMQIAMPSSVGLWAASFAEEIMDDLIAVETAFNLNDMCPLGSAASYGVPLPLNREMVAKALGFRRVQNNVLYVNNSRGKIEGILLDAVGYVMLTLSKLSQDLILFTMPEFRYFTLPKEICTGSSIMPQKRNPAMLELIRARSATVISLASQVKNIVRALPSGYNRDFQDTKEPLMKGFQISLASVKVMKLVIEKLTVNQDHLISGFIPEIFATDRALELVAEGTPFRDAYQKVGRDLDNLQAQNPLEAVEKKNYPGAPGNLNLQEVSQHILNKEQWLNSHRQTVQQKMKSLTGMEVSLSE